MLRQTEFVKAQVTLAAWREGTHFGGHLPMQMIAHSLANRYKQGWGDWSGVLERMAMFSAIESIDQRQPDLQDPNFVKLLQAIDGIVDGTAKDMTNGGLYFADLAKPVRDWFRENILDQPEAHPRCANNVTLTFFR